ncbi:hypothetical protein DWQ65_07910 [Treponema phagedenis]|uniref:Lipoprotein n=1 Tax=Treponema phagedenis TaxID=162 RepID=A0A0B7GWM5_TREPH|nr:hypothetical protein [Treponema phagedenis]NVP24877.1 hypothetical protein [Treponema phagedenis]QEJ94343.1 hypothetical protein FUT79_03390 [Treponema phagedenis]QEJ98980.1 hypothetical protein FUT82_13940 [Treponema phagedenis]QEK00305.1 hypothetical protein FUT84_03360 [Treponema phagedenis]QEK04488.1 hypothetical protein FUT83_12240 [Treponema phagedenis]
MKHKIIFAFICVAGIFSSCASTKKEKLAEPNYPMQKLGAIRANTVNRVNKQLSPKVFSFLFIPTTNLVQMHHKFMGDNIWVDLTAEGRAAMIEAMNKYIEEYEAKKLTKENDKKKAYFGKADMLVTWGVLGGAHEAMPTVRFEYQFITPKRPYFIIGNATTASSDGNNCPAMRMAFSPAQCKQVIEYLKQENIDAMMEAVKADFDKFDIDDTDKTFEELENQSEANSAEPDVEEGF